MAVWKYTLKSGLLLRDAIQNDDNKHTLNVLKKCYKEMREILPEDIYTEGDYDYDISEVDNQLDNLENYEEYDMTEEDCQNEINYILQNLYDFCDQNRIWLDLI